MRVLIHSNHPKRRTGYAIQAGHLAKMLAYLGHDVALSAFSGQDGYTATWEGFPVYPGGVDPWGCDIVAGHYHHWKADLLITLMDVWVITPELLAGAGLRVAHWVPVDCEPLGAADAAMLAATGGTPIAMSRHGQAMLRQAGLAAGYAPHAIDTATFAPPADKAAAKAAAGFAGQFVAGMCAANSDKHRKGFDEAFQAFARFHVKHPSAVLAVNTRWHGHDPRGGGGLDLAALAARRGIASAVRYCDQHAYASGLISDEALARFYGACDVLLNPSLGEGFGLPIIEAQACGTPVVTTRASSMPELTGAGWCVPGQARYNWLQDADWITPDVGALYAALEAAWSSRGRPAERRAERARAFALPYDVAAVRDSYWQPVMTELAAVP